MKRSTVVALVAAVLFAAGCGGSDDDGGGRSGDAPVAAQQRAELKGADVPTAEQFPKPQTGQTLQALANSIGASGTQVGLATSVFTPGHNRLAFGVIDERNAFVYGPSALYVARSPESTDVVGPYLAPADLLVTEPAFRSQQAASEGDPFAAIYQADAVELEKPGKYAVLTVTQVDGKLMAGATEIRVAKRSPVPEPGDKAPVVDTDTIASAGSIEAVDTRRPVARELHETSFKDVVGKKPVALLFVTPQLCESRVCGPVVDIALQLKQKYGDRVEFIHQEVYVDNDASKGLREPLRRFGVPTEPWLFAIGRDGRVASRLEGSFGLDAFEKAVKAALARG
jgi:hypothetical protein